jgi:ABC-type nickel/cobalt efflux system permease component RcnA
MMALEWLSALIVEVIVLVLLGGVAVWWLLRRMRRLEAEANAQSEEPDPPTHH